MKYLKLYESFHNYSPIGFIDSGYGGVAIMKAVMERFPEYDYQFLGVSPNKTLSVLDTQTATNLTESGISHLRSLGCSNIVVACNTACTLIDSWPLDTVNLINETINYISQINYKNLGVLATPVTIKSGHYQKSLSNVIPHRCDSWAKLVEDLSFDTPEGIEIIKSDLDLLFSQADIDTVLLACTHYILLKPIIQSLYPNIRIISQDEIMVNYFSQNQVTSSKNRSCKWLTCGLSEEFDTEVKELFGIITHSQQVIL